MQSPTYTLEDLIVDPAFIKWVKAPHEADGRNWEEWAALSAANAHVILQARDLINELASDTDSPLQGELDDLWTRIEASNQEWDERQQPKVVSLKTVVKTWYRIAAVTVGILMISAGAWMYLFNGTQEEKTQFGEQRTLVLPDSSIVVLNANSTVSYSKNWDKQQPREVYLEGEAFFSVTHQKNHQKFIVHTPDLDVQVLGTRFNVNSRHHKTRVMLKSGKVKLLLTKAQNQEVDMKPGELVDFSTNVYSVKKKVVKPSVYTAWMEKKLVFEEATLGEVAQVLEDNYGYKTQFTSNDLAALTFTGSVESGNVNLLLTILQKTFNISIAKKDDNLIISRK